MNRVEEHLNQAAVEVREVARRLNPPPLDTSSGARSRPWLAFAAAFVVVVVAIGLVPLLLGNGQDPLGTTPTTGLPTPSTTVGRDPNAGQCSAAGVPTPGPVEGLPEPVATTRQAIIDAGAICDLDALESVAGELTTSFGGGGFDNLREWETNGAGQLGVLVQLLGTSHTVLEVQEGPDIYVWPAAFGFESWDEVPDQYREELVEIFGEGEIDQIIGFGSYLGWRVGIDETGDWLYFVAGD